MEGKRTEKRGEDVAKLAVIADDLTGANDTALQFAKRGISTCVWIDDRRDDASWRSADVVVLNTDSRDMKKDEAYKTVREAALLLKRRCVKLVYKKVDSTLRGNFGAEVAAVDDVFAPDLVVIAPAFPQNQRVTIGGYHLLEGVPIELTEIANAPTTPVRESCIANLIAEQAGRRTALVSLATIKRGSAAVCREIEACMARGERWLIFDVALEAHFETILRSLPRDREVLWVGSAGLANHLPVLCDWQPRRMVAARMREGAALVVAGSVSHKTQAQIAALKARPDVRFVVIDVSALLDNRQAEIGRCTEEIVSGVRKGQDILLASGAADSDVASAVRAGRRQGMNGKAVSAYTAASIARIVGALDTGAFAGLVLTGGDTASHVLRALEAEAIEVLAEVAVGIPLGRIKGGRCDGMSVVTKAGAFGESDCLIKALAQMRAED